MGSELFGVIISRKHSCSERTLLTYLYFLPLGQDMSAALILMLASINLLIWRQLRPLPFVSTQACAFYPARRWFALLSVRVIKPQREVELVIDAFNLFCAECGWDGAHNDVGTAHWCVMHTRYNHVQTRAALRPVRRPSHFQAISCSRADGLPESRTKPQKSAQMCERVETSESCTTSHHFKEAAFFTRAAAWLSFPWPATLLWCLHGLNFWLIWKRWKAVTREPITLSRIAWFHLFFIGGTAWKGCLQPKHPVVPPDHPFRPQHPATFH